MDTPLSLELGEGDDGEEEEWSPTLDTPMLV